jgi:hypothetical protein
MTGLVDMKSVEELFMCAEKSVLALKMISLRLLVVANQPNNKQSDLNLTMIFFSLKKMLKE